MKQKEYVEEFKKPEFKFDIYRDRQMLDLFANEVSLYGNFDDYCREKKLLILSEAGFGIMAVNVDKAQQYRNDCEKWSAVKRIRDLYPQKYGIYAKPANFLKS